MLTGKIRWKSGTIFQSGSMATVTCGRMWRGVQRMAEFLLIRAQYSLTKNSKPFFFVKVETAGE
jgi:hypothetical protein